MTVTLQDPVLSPLRVAPETLQNFDELDTTFSLTLDDESTLSFANAAIDFNETALDNVTLGDVTDVEFGTMAGVFTGSATG